MALRDDIDPRVERSRHQVIAATVELLREVGYGPLTIEAIAARSGVAKSTIYRHWPGKPQLVADAFARVARGADEETIPPPGPVRDRVVAVLQDLLVTMVGSHTRLACLMPALIDAAERSDEIASLSCRLAEESAGPLLGVLDDAVRSGELPTGTDTRVLADALAGPILLCRLFHRPAVAVDEVPALVDQILPPARGAVPSTDPA